MGADHVGVALTDLRGRVLAWHSRGHPGAHRPGRLARAGRRALRRPASLMPPAGGPSSASGWRCPARSILRGLTTSPKWSSRPGRVGSGSRSSAHASARRSWWTTTPTSAPLPSTAGAPAAASTTSPTSRWPPASAAAIVINGEIYRGATGVAGEIGHLAIAPQGKPCICGLRGCLATLVGAQALVERAGRAARRRTRRAAWPAAPAPSPTSRTPPWPATRSRGRSPPKPPSTWASPWPGCSTS